MIDAALWAYCMRKPLNRFITIHLASAGLTSDPQSYLTLFMKRTGDWLRYHTDDPPYYVYVFENPQDRGLHLHLLVHVPLGFWKRFCTNAGRWSKEIIVDLDGRSRSGVFQNEKLYSLDPREGGEVFDYLKDLRRVLRYMIKGVEPSGEDLIQKLSADLVHGDLAWDHPLGNQGIVHGKRCGYSEACSRQRRVIVASSPSLRFPKFRRMTQEQAALRLLEFAGLNFEVPPAIVFDSH